MKKRKALHLSLLEGKHAPPDEADTFGEIPNDIWDHQKWFVGKVQIPLGGNMEKALIYDKTHDWEMYIPMSWMKNVPMKGKAKQYFWMWFNEEHALNMEVGTPVEEEPFW